MTTIDSITLLVGILLAALGFAVGFGRALRFFTKGIFGFVISVFVCATFGGMIAGIPAVSKLISDLNEYLGGKWSFLETIHLATAVYYLILFAAVQILRIAVVRLIGAIFSADNSVMRLLNRVFGTLFMVAAVFLLTLLVLAVFRIFDDTSFVQGIVEDISGSFLGTLYRHNPVKFVS